jgi:membrane associated rhomboid family serine protease
MLFPGSQVRVLMGRAVVPMPALIVIGFWIVLQLVSGVGSISHAAAQGGGVAYMAHVGGFVAGLVLTMFFRGRPGASIG